MDEKVMAIEAGTTYEKRMADLNAKLASTGKQPIDMQTYPSASSVIERILGPRNWPHHPTV
jgi:polar amino acid transport system substrate-binding protein